VTDPRSRDRDLPGVSVFSRDEAGEVFHTNSTYTRGPDALLGPITTWTSPRRPQRQRLSEQAPPPRRIRQGRVVTWLSAEDRYADKPQLSLPQV
jgi:predicted dithiol-disulfide oxidoreductase (DUF899 family)